MALRWEDVDLDSGAAALTGTVVRLWPGADGPSHLVRQDTTAGRKTRHLRLPVFAITLLQERAAAGRDGGEHDLVLPSVVAILRDVATVERQWRGFRDRQPRVVLEQFGTPGEITSGEGAGPADASLASQPPATPAWLEVA